MYFILVNYEILCSVESTVVYFSYWESVGIFEKWVLN